MADKQSRQGPRAGRSHSAVRLLYRQIIARYRDQKKDASHPHLVINSIDLDRMRSLIEADRLQDLTEFLLGQIRKLGDAGRFRRARFIRAGRLFTWARIHTRSADVRVGSARSALLIMPKVVCNIRSSFLDSTRRWLGAWHPVAPRLIFCARNGTCLLRQVYFKVTAQIC